MLDLKTVLIVALATASLQAAAWVFVWRAWRHLYELKFLAAGFGAIALGLLLMIVRGPEPGPLASDDRIRGFESGADIYLVKHSTLREIEAATRSLLRRNGSLPASVNGHGDRWVLDGTNWFLIAPNHRSLKLTATEFAFMSALCSRGGTCQREDLMETLARPRSNFGNRHLDAIVSRLRRKIEESTSLPAPIKVVYGVGYTFTATTIVE